MNSKKRFLNAMQSKAIDRVPLFNEGMRKKVIDKWHKEGLAPDEHPGQIFTYDRKEEFAPDLDPSKFPIEFAPTSQGLEELHVSFFSSGKSQLPANWSEQAKIWKTRTFPLFLRVHRGFFQTMGVQNWENFTEAIYLLADNPEFVRQALIIHGEFTARFIEKMLQEINFDAAVFSEPIAGSSAPLISPKTYKEIVLPGYIPILEVLQKYKIKTIIFRSYANAYKLLPVVFDSGFNCLWANERNCQELDYLKLADEFGEDLRLIGGIDLDVLFRDKSAIKYEIRRVVPKLLDRGGFIPLLDGRVRKNISYKKYKFYRKLLEDIIFQS